MTDPDGYLTAAGFRWLAVLVLVAALAVVSYMGQHDTRDEPPAPTPTTTTTAAPPASTSTTSTPPGSSTTTSTTRPPSPPTTAAPRRVALEWAVSSTVYCDHGVTASGQHTRDGIVSVSFADFPRLRGTRWRVTAGPPEIIGRTFVVADKGSRAEFDVWMGNHPDCPRWGRYTYGRKPATVVPA